MEKETVEVSAAMIVKDGYLLAAQKGYGIFKGKWELPGGKIKSGESPQDTVIREIKEELNADIDIDDYFLTVNHEYDSFRLVMHTFLCSLKSGYNYVFHSDSELEHDSLVWLEKEDLDLIDWLPADRIVINEYKETLRSR